MDKQILTTLTAEELVRAIKDGIKEVIELSSANSQDQDGGEQLLSIEDVQKIFNVSKVTIHKWKKKGLIPYYKLNRKVYFKKSEVINSLQDKKRKMEV